MPVSTEITFLTRTNTLCYDLKSVYEPSLDDKSMSTSRSMALSRRIWCDFLLNTLSVNSTDLVEAFVHQQTNHLMVKFKDSAVFETQKERALKGIAWQLSHQPVFGWSTEEILTTVKVVNLSVHVNEKKVVNFLANYGKVVHWQKGYIKELPGVFDGTLTAKMAISKDENGYEKVIPSFIEIEEIGEYLQVFSELTSRTCFRCGQVGHIAPYCKKKPVHHDELKPGNAWSTIAARVPDEELSIKILSGCNPCLPVKPKKTVQSGRSESRSLTRVDPLLRLAPNGKPVRNIDRSQSDNNGRTDKAPKKRSCSRGSDTPKDKIPKDSQNEGT